MVELQNPILYTSNRKVNYQKFQRSLGLSSIKFEPMKASIKVYINIKCDYLHLNQKMKLFSKRF
jgi:hypothetical protein